MSDLGRADHGGDYELMIRTRALYYEKLVSSSVAFSGCLAKGKTLLGHNLRKMLCRIYGALNMPCPKHMSLSHLKISGTVGKVNFERANGSKPKCTRRDVKVRGTQSMSQEQFSSTGSTEESSIRNIWLPLTVEFQHAKDTVLNLHMIRIQDDEIPNIRCLVFSKACNWTPGKNKMEYGTFRIHNPPQREK